MIPESFENSDGIRELRPSDLLKYRAGVSIIDVRRPEEFSGELGHIESAKLLTLEKEFKEEIGKLSRELPIVFVCRSGGRSAKATRYAQSLGFKEVYNLFGGMLHWNELQLPIKK